MDLKTAERIARGENLIAEAERLLAKHRADKKAARARRRSRSPRASGTDKKARKVTAIERRREVYAAVDARSTCYCEACFLDGQLAPGASRDHFWGRAREESVESVWKLCIPCDRAKTENKPTRIWWLERFRRHAIAHGYHQQAAKATAAIDYELAQHPEHRRTEP